MSGTQTRTLADLKDALAAQAVGDDRGEPAEHQSLGVDQHPLLGHLRRLQREGGLEHAALPDRLGE